MILNLFTKTGQFVFDVLDVLGRLMYFCLKSIFRGFQSPFYGREIIFQFYKIGYASLPVVGLTAFFTGGALALQIFEGGQSRLLILNKSYC